MYIYVPIHQLHTNLSCVCDTQPVNNADFIVPVEIEGVIHQVYVLKRPHCDEFLRRMGDMFECILFTASLAKVSHVRERERGGGRRGREGGGGGGGERGRERERERERLRERETVRERL